MSGHISNSFVLAAGALAALCLPHGALAQPVNDNCTNATPATVGEVTIGTLTGATPDGDSSCSGGPAPDAYHTITTTIAGVYTFSLCGGVTWDSVLSIHSGCPATVDNEIGCDDDGCRPAGGEFGGYASVLTAYLNAGATYVLRVAPFDSTVDAGDYALTVTGPTPMTGACCRPAGCTIVTQLACAAPDDQGAPGIYGGDLSACLLPAGAPASYADDPGAYPIPDDAPAGLTRTITVPDSFIIGDVRVVLTIDHGCVGDLTIRLFHGTSVATILQHVGVGPLGSDASLAGKYTFTDGADATVWQYAPLAASGHPVPPGSYFCTGADAGVLGLRQRFSGLDAAGDWSLQIIDSSPGYTGVLHSWSIAVDRAGIQTCSAPQGACCTGGACTQLTFGECGAIGGSFKGAGVVCTDGPNNPVACCRANFNGVNGLNAQDIFDFLSAWFASDPAADFDGGGLSPSDIFAFIQAWFAGC